jgi:large subunit ribosomal protein L22
MAVSTPTRRPTALKDRPTTRAQVRYVRMSASKARQVLDLIRGKSIAEADEVLALSERDAALVIQKCLRSAVANAEHNDGLDPEELFVAACFADEGPTLRRFRPRARGRATRIRKRTCHITVVVGRYDADEMAARDARQAARGAGGGRTRPDASRRARVAKSRGEDLLEETEETEETDEVTEDVQPDAEVTADEQPQADEPAAETDDDADGSTESTEPVAETDAQPEGATAEALAEAHSKPELLAMADEAGVNVAKSWNKAQIAEAIVNGREDD